MLVVCSLLAMIFVLLHCHPATKKLCPHAEVLLAFRDHGIITTSSNKTEPNVTYTNRLVLVHDNNVGDNKEEHHVTCTNWIPLYIHTRKFRS